jgi:aspartyl-tRNA(Asn)/glutamyl-tRNA(Gln) amidotransferase subunit A
MDSHELHWLGIYELSRRIGTGELSPLDVVDALIERIEALNPKILGFIEVTAEAARVEAIKAEEEIAAGRKKGPLHGIPYGVKDIIDTAGVRTTRGSSVFMNRVPDEDAGCIDRLREAGAILIGKCLTQEFASGPLSHNPHFGTARNPWDLSRITGGSSTGSAASVSGGLCPAPL